MLFKKRVSIRERSEEWPYVVKLKKEVSVFVKDIKTIGMKTKSQNVN